MANFLDKLFCDYVLVIMRPSGIFLRRYYTDYDKMYDVASCLQLTPNCKYAKGMMKKRGRWITLFTLDKPENNK